MFIKFKFCMLFLILFTVILLSSCAENVEKEFGTFCAKTSFNPERQLFSSDIDGSVKFQLDESTDKSSGRLLIGGLSSMAQGVNEINFDTQTDPQECSDCIFIFFREKPDKFYRVVSGRINVELIYFDTKDRVAFATGSFQRLVFKNENGGDCAVIEDMEFKFY